MIKNELLFPEYYVNPVPICDSCNINLEFTETVYLTNPQQYLYKCPKCSKKYTFLENEIKGYWKWRVI